ncbi:hypothetical protein EVAR_18363_1 [Eumeta japonica]|uniref:Reverse transcriptase domain-containing protein n=1 Tax=Eumeta variegata TaxID=151549 RepID=A0A4C1UVR0_EUMVA|nr:hypothetical protein EVAR_18363_1 [Eumeta japonica]
MYSLYTKDVPRHSKMELEIFADDTALYTLDARSKALTHHQTATDALGNLFKKWKIEVNPEKSAAMYFYADQARCRGNSCQAHRPSTSNKVFQTPNTGTARAVSAALSDNLSRDPCLIEAPFRQSVKLSALEYSARGALSITLSARMSECGTAQHSPCVVVRAPVRTKSP